MVTVTASEKTFVNPSVRGCVSPRRVFASGATVRNGVAGAAWTVMLNVPLIPPGADAVIVTVPAESGVTVSWIEAALAAIVAVAGRASTAGLEDASVTTSGCAMVGRLEIVTFQGRSAWMIGGALTPRWGKAPVSTRKLAPLPSGEMLGARTAISACPSARKSTVNDVAVWPAAMVTFDGAEMREGVDVVIVTGTGTGCAVST